MEERTVHLDLMVITHDQPAEVAQPGKRAFDFPSAFVPPKLPAVLRLELLAVAAVLADQFDATLLRPATTRPRYRDLFQRRLDQRGLHFHSCNFNFLISFFTSGDDRK